MGKLIPVQVQEVLPGDTLRLSTSALIRLAPMLAPVMHPVTVRIHHWFVPNRIVWDSWEDFITGGKDNANTDTVPQISNGDSKGTILDYMGVPPLDGETVNALPVRAYNKIYNEFYRDQDLIDEINEENISVLNCAWRKDYFTAARPWPQKGSDIVLPIGDRAPVATDQTPGSGNNVDVFASEAPGYRQLGSDQDYTYLSTTGGTEANSLYADLSQATGVTATEFREFFALQRYAEARSRYGSRYTEYLRYIGVKPSDARLQRPEYLGGGKSTIQFSEVLQTGEGVDPVGTLRGHGITAMRSKGVRRFFEEHGHVITLMSIVPKSIYQNGVQRNWLRLDKEDYFQRELQSIGQQKVQQKEVYFDSDPDEIFGYQDRYSEYLTCPSGVSGDFRDILNYWHLARDFQDAPNLNEEFINCEPTKRIFAEQTTHPLWCMVNNSVVARRMVKKVSIGKLL